MILTVFNILYWQEWMWLYLVITVTNVIHCSTNHTWICWIWTVFRIQYFCCTWASSRSRILTYLWTLCIFTIETSFPFERQSSLINASITWIFWCLPMMTSFITSVFNLFPGWLAIEWNMLGKGYVCHCCLHIFCKEADLSDHLPVCSRQQSQQTVYTEQGKTS